MSPSTAPEPAGLPSTEGDPEDTLPRSSPGSSTHPLAPHHQGGPPSSSPHEVPPSAPCPSSTVQVACADAAAPPWDPTAEEIAERFFELRAYVARVGRRVLGSAADIDDLLQDVFVVTMQSAGSVRDPERFKGWLATVTTRMARKRRFRPSAHEPSYLEEPEELVQFASEAPSPESTAHLAGHIQRLMSLPEELRTPWMLRHLEGKTLEDIAEHCDCSTSTAQRRIRSVSDRITTWKRWS